MTESIKDNKDFIRSLSRSISCQCPCVLKTFSKDETDLCFYVGSSVVLTQKPQESCEVRLDLTKPTGTPSDQNGLYQRHCHLVLIFANNLHEVSQNYIYEVSLKLLVFHDMHYYHVHCFTRRQVRVNDTIMFDEPKMYISKPLSSTNVASTLTEENSIIHICLDVRRLDKLEWVKNIHASSNIDVGTMLLKNSVYSDVSLQVGDTSFPAHKFILSKKSVVFRAMFAHKMAESQSGLVKIDNFDSKVIDEMLTYMYTGKSENVSEMAVDLFKVAHMYELDELKAVCEEYLLFNIDIKNVVDLLELSDLYDLKDMRECTFKFIDIHEEKMVKQDRFLQYFTESLKIRNIAYTLKLCVKYQLAHLQQNVFEFIKNNKEIRNDKDFLNLFISHPLLMQDLFQYLFQ